MIADPRPIIAALQYIIESVKLRQSFDMQGNCNNCGNKTCEFMPEWGEPVRINCPHYINGKTYEVR